MKKKDLYDELCKNYEFLLGTIPNRDEFKRALQQTLTEQDIKVIFLLPFQGEMSMAKLEKKAARIGISPSQVHEIVSRLVPEGFIASFIKPPDGGKAGMAYRVPAPLTDMRHERRVLMRGSMVSMTEMQVRKHERDPMRQAAAHYFNAMTEDAARSIPTQTPYFRVLPVEATLSETPAYGEIVINAVIPDPREVLPLDIISEMVKREPIIAVAECYCRRTKLIVGEGCDHPMETCLYFNELALLQIETGRARQIECDEALRILHECEEAGLVHNVSNCKGHISVLCACCACSCGVIKSWKLGGTNAGGPSRFVVAYDKSKCVLCKACVDVCPIDIISASDQGIEIDLERCIGCGLCVYNCPESSLHMVLREHPPKVYADGKGLMRRMSIEALVGLVKKKVMGKY